MNDDQGPDRKPLTILLAEGSSTSARQLLYCLEPGDRVDVLDPDPLCQCRFSRWRRRFHRCPHYGRDPLGYLGFLVARLREEKYDVLLVSHEQAYLLSRVRRQLGDLVGLALPGFDAVSRMQNKATFIRLLDEIGLPHPRSTIVRTRDDLMRAASFPCFVKVAHGTAGIGVHQVTSREDLGHAAARLEEAGELDGKGEVIVQEPATGELAVACSVFQRGRLVGHHLAHARRYRIGTLARESVDHAGVADELDRIGAHLDWHGGLFIEYFFDQATGRRQYIEANPRPGELLNARLCGTNLCEQLIRVSLGEEARPLPAARTGVRSHQGYLLALATAVDGGSRGGIFSEVLRARRQTGFYENSVDELMRPDEDFPSVVPAAAILVQLALAPSSAGRIVRGAVEAYSLPGPAARAIDALTGEELTACFES